MLPVFPVFKPQTTVTHLTAIIPDLFVLFALIVFDSSNDTFCRESKLTRRRGGGVDFSSLIRCFSFISDTLTRIEQLLRLSAAAAAAAVEGERSDGWQHGIGSSADPIDRNGVSQQNQDNGSRPKGKDFVSTKHSAFTRPLPPPPHLSTPTSHQV